MNRGRAAAWAVASSVLVTMPTVASVAQYGDADLLNTGSWSSDPWIGATLEGLAPGVSTFGTAVEGHGFPFSPSVGEFPGTDQIYVGSSQTGFSDGYSSSNDRLAGPQVITLDYSSQVLAGEVIDSFTLGIAADDFQFPVFGQPYRVTLNGQAYQPLTDVLNGLDQTGPVTRFFTIGLPLSILDPSHVLVLSIDQGASGSDGWAIDFLTTGVTTVPAPAAAVLLAAAGLSGVRRRR